MTDTHTHSVLFVKLDGIGDYLFFRLFWPQIAQVIQQKGQDVSLLCSSSFLPIVEKYDRAYIKNFFTLDDVKKWGKAKFLLFIPRYYRMFVRGLEGRLLWRKKWQAAYNMQPLREVFVENVMSRVNSLSKITNKDVNELLAPSGFYQDALYTQLLSVSRKQFIVPFFRELLEKSLGGSFKIPALQLPFSKEDILLTSQRRKLDKRYIVFVPFTSTPLRNWPMDRFVFLAKKLSENTSLPVVVVGKCKQNPHQIWKKCPNVIDLVNQTSLLEAMQIAAGATYAVCSDTSLMHCALLGQAHTICLSSGRAKELFVNYPTESNVKQKIFFPSICGAKGIGRIEDIAVEPVWQYIQAEWLSA